MNDLNALSDSHPFRELWAINGQQKRRLTCMAISPAGNWIASGSEDGTFMLANFRTGALAGTIDLESRFCVNSLAWRSESQLLTGCTNGVFYNIDFDLASQSPIAMRPLCQPLKEPIRALNLDGPRGMLAVASGGDVYVYACSEATNGQEERWDCIDHITAPNTGRQAIITGLQFFGSTLGPRPLFIAHAKSGFNLWTSPHNYQRAPYTSDGNMCTVGAVAISPDETLLAVSTLQQSIVTYRLTTEGPVLSSRVEVGYKEKTDYRPGLPIAFTADKLIVKGTASGAVPILDSKTGTTSVLRHGSQQVICALATHGDKLVVGSSTASGDIAGDCIIKCYSSLMIDQQVFTRKQDPSPTFNVGIGTLIPPVDEESSTLLAWSQMWEGLAGALTLERLRKYLVILLALMMLLLAIIMDPPGKKTPLPRQESSTEVSVFRAPHHWHSSTRTRAKPTLWSLTRHGVTYLIAKFAIWLRWLLSLTKSSAIWSFKALIRALWVVPNGLKYLVTELPGALVNVICDVLNEYDLSDVCK